MKDLTDKLQELEVEKEKVLNNSSLLRQTVSYATVPSEAKSDHPQTASQMQAQRESVKPDTQKALISGLEVSLKAARAETAALKKSLVELQDQVRLVSELRPCRDPLLTPSNSVLYAVRAHNCKKCRCQDEQGNQPTGSFSLRSTIPLIACRSRNDSRVHQKDIQHFHFSSVWRGVRDDMLMAKVGVNWLNCTLSSGRLIEIWTP